LHRTRLTEGGLEISRIVFGSMGRRASSETERTRTLHAAIDAGTTTIDTAPLYDFGEVESFLGRALRDHRNEVEILSKVGLRWDDDHGEILFEFHDATGTPRAVRRDSRPAAIRRDVEASLERLRTDRLDLCQIHQPDLATPIEDSLGELARLAEEGKIRHLGVSNFDAAQLESALRPGDEPARTHPVVSNQIHFSLLTQHQAQDLAGLARRCDVGWLAYSPLEAGALSEAMLAPAGLDASARARSYHFRPANAEQIRQALTDVVLPVARQRQASVSQICLAWLLHQDSVRGVIVGASDADQARANAGATEIALDAGELSAMAERFARLRLDPLAGQGWRDRGAHLLGRVRRKARRLLGRG